MAVLFMAARMRAWRRSGAFESAVWETWFSQWARERFGQRTWIKAQDPAQACLDR
jgi:hypothetical protein